MLTAFFNKARRIGEFLKQETRLGTAVENVEVFSGSLGQCALRLVRAKLTPSSGVYKGGKV